MANVKDVETAEIYDKATTALNEKGKRFVKRLNRNGSPKFPAVQATNITTVFEHVAKMGTKEVVKTASKTRCEDGVETRCEEGVVG